MDKKSKRPFWIGFGSLIAAIVACFSLFGVLGDKEKIPADGEVQVFSAPTTEAVQVIEICDTTFSGGETYITVNEGTIYEVKNCVFDGAQNSAIVVDGGEINLENCTIKNGQDSGIFVTSGKVTMTDTTVRENLGSGVVTNENSTVQVNGSSNFLKNGGDGLCLSEAYDTLIFGSKDKSFTGLIAENAGSGIGTYYSESTNDYNSCSSVFMYGGTVGAGVVGDESFLGNSKGVSGMHSLYGFIFNFNETTITGNTGVGVYGDYENCVYLTDCVISENGSHGVETCEGLDVVRGSIMYNGADGVNARGSINYELSILDTSIMGNGANGVSLVEGSDNKLTIGDCTIIDNDGHGIHNEGNMVIAGTTCVFGNGLHGVNIVAETTNFGSEDENFHGFVAGNVGYGIFAQGASSTPQINFFGGTIGEGSFMDEEVVGGLVYLDRANANFSNTTIKKGVELYGTTAVFTDCVIDGNTSGTGLLIYEFSEYGENVVGSTATINGETRITNNQTGVDVGSESQLIMKAGLIAQNNYSGVDVGVGNVSDLNAGTFTLEGGVVGAGTIDGVAYSGNSTGVVLYHTIYGATFVMTGGEVSSNTSDGVSGASESFVTVSGGSIHDNGGCGISSWGYEVSVQNAKIYGNGGDGVSMSSGWSSYLTVQNSEIYDNAGSGIWAEGYVDDYADYPMNCIISNVVVHGNQENGMVVSVPSEGTTFAGVESYGNAGCGLRVSGSNASLSITGAKVYQNNTGVDLGGFADGKTCTISSSNIYSNTGVGINCNKTALNVSDTKVYANTGDGIFAFVDDGSGAAVSLSISGATSILNNGANGLRLSFVDATINTTGIFAGNANAGVSVSASDVTFDNGGLGSGTIDGVAYGGNKFGVLTNNAGDGTISNFHMNAGQVNENTDTGVKIAARTRFYLHGGDIFANKVRGVNCSGYFYMYGGEIYNHVNSSVDGAGAYIITVPYFSGGSFHDNTGNNGGGVYLKESKYVYEFGEVEFKNNTAKNGGGMFVEGSELYSVETAFDGTIFDGNTATQYGGGLYLGANSGATLSSTTTIKNNVAVDGAGVYASDQTVSLTTAATFDGNTASHFGGGLYVAQDADLAFDTGSVFNQNSVRNEESTVSGGAIYFAGGTYEVKGAFTSNSSLSTSGYGHGGAIYAVSSTLTFTDATFDGNDCKTSGAAVFLSSSSLNFASGSMNQNTAGYAGSGIALMGANTVTIESGVTIQNGTSSNGAIFMQGRSSSNQAVLEMKGKLSNNTATNGGGIYANSNAKIKLYSSALISLCKAAANGGGVCLNKSSSLENEETHGLNFINNCSAKNGGGIYVGDSSIATIWGGISNSTATADGGGIYLKSNTSEVLLWSKIYGCSANRGGGIFGNTGSAINIDGEIYSGSINNCEASYGGGIYLFSNNNTATSQIGGKITGCTATKNGGGLYSDNISNLTFNGEILGCSASKNGGGIYSVDSTLNLGTTSISARVETCAADVGGGVYVTGGSGNFVGGLISGNTAKYGGGLASANSAEITLGIVDDLYHGGDTGFIVTLNTATRFGGGAYFASGSSVLMDDGVSINSNKVQNLLTITKELQIGTAPQTISYTYTYAYSDRGIGAGVFLDNDVVMTMQGDHWCEVIGNEVIADNSTDDQLFKMCLGGGISVSGTSTLIMNDGWISNNSVDTKITNSVGGNVNVGPDGTFKMSGGTISGNGYLQATLGGGILSTGVVEVTGGLIDSCVAKYGGGIASYGGYKVEYSSYSYDLSRNTLSIGGDVVVENCVALGETDDNQTAHSSTGHIGDGVLVGGIINFSGNPKFVNNSVALSAQKNIYVKVVVNIGIDKARYPTINASKDFSPVNPITLNFVQASLTITSISDKTIEYSVSNSSDLLDAYYSGSDGGSQVPLVVGDSDITDFVLASGKSIYGVKNESTSDEYIYVGTLTVQAVASNNETIFVKPAEVYFDKKSFLKHVQVK